MKNLPIDLEVLADEMDYESLYGDFRRFLDTETGEIMHLDEDLALQFEHDEEVEYDDQMAWEREELQQLRAMQDDPDRYEEIPVIEPEEAVGEMLEFAETIKDAKLKASAKRALKSADSNGKFTQFLAKHPKEKLRWRAFHEAWLLEKARSWLTSLEIVARK